MLMVEDVPGQDLNILNPKSLKYPKIILNPLPHKIFPAKFFRTAEVSTPSRRSA
jgi:hypothetical protein